MPPLAKTSKHLAIKTVLDANAVFANKLSGEEGISRLFEYRVDVCGEGGGHRLCRRSRHQCHRAPGHARRRDALPQRLRARDPLHRHRRPPLDPPRAGPGALAVVPHPHGRLPHLPEQDHAPDRGRSPQEPRLQRLHVRADRELPDARLLRAVPRDGLQLRQPPDGGGGHVLLLPPPGRAPRDGDRRRDELPRVLARARGDPLQRPRRRGGGPGRHHRVEPPARSCSPAPTRSTTSTSRRPARTCEPRRTSPATMPPPSSKSTTTPDSTWTPPRASAAPGSGSRKGSATTSRPGPEGTRARWRPATGSVSRTMPAAGRGSSSRRTPASACPSRRWTGAACSRSRLR